MIEQGKRYVVTTDNWFQAPNGDSYKAAWGTCTVLDVATVFNGFQPHRPSTNWFMRVGSGDGHVLIAGCQIHYAVRSDDPPIDRQTGKTYIDKESGLEWTASRVYVADSKEQE